MAYPTSFKEGNQAAKKSPKIVLKKFQEMLYLSENDDTILSFQDACIRIKWRQSKVEYWVNKIPVFETLKKDIQNRIIARINSGALKGNYNPTASIWRQKQLGEHDSSNLDVTTKGKQLDNSPPVFIFKKLNESTD